MSAKVFSSHLFDELVGQASASPRKRQHLNIHEKYEDPCQRFFNAIGTDSYIRPHRHLLDPKAESIIAIRGLFALVLFDEQGNVVRAERFGTEGRCINAGVEVAPGAWHTIVALTSQAVLLELKGGPFLPSAAKEFAAWAPVEGTDAAGPYLRFLQSAIGPV
jgi:cupin fold WbuC family metalloprotein